VSESRDERIITFYSFKGGTGRSMALANVGYLFSSQTFGAKRVLLIDWDLEAPGLHRYFSQVQKIRQSKSNPDQSPGLMGFFCAALQRYQASHEITQAVLEGKTTLLSKRKVSPEDQVEESLSKVEVARAEIRKRLILDLEGFITHLDDPIIDLLTAGTGDDTYAESVRTFNWEEFHDYDPGFFPAFRSSLVEKYDFVLIDSRTGFTDTSGICTKQLPETLVLVFAPNRQNLDGLTKLVKQVRSYRFATVDPRPLMIYPLASRIDSAASRLRNTWRHGGSDSSGEIPGYQPTFEKMLKETYDLEKCDLGHYFDITQVPHDSDYAYGESIASRENTSDKLSMGYAYVNLVKRIAADIAPWEADDPEPVPPRQIGKKDESSPSNESSGFRARIKAGLPKHWGVGVFIAILSIFLSLGTFVYQQLRRTQMELDAKNRQLSSLTKPTPTPSPTLTPATGPTLTATSTATPTPPPLIRGPGKWGLVVVGVQETTDVASTNQKAMDAGLRNIAIFENRGGAETVAQFADKATATSQLNALPADLAKNSFVAEIRSWCKGPKYVGTQITKRLNNAPENNIVLFRCEDGSMVRPSPSNNPVPGKWGVVVVILSHASAVTTTQVAQAIGLKNLAIFENREGAETVAQFADEATATAQLNALPPDIAKNSFVVEVRSWCKAATYAGTQTAKGMSPTMREGSVPLFKCSDDSMVRPGSVILR